jgi:acetyl-CoA carboxylase biotin carboxylase subunit
MRFSWVMGPKELSLILCEQMEELGFQSEVVATPKTEEELRSWALARSKEYPGGFVHPGLSRWSDRPEFPQIISQAGLIPVSPSPKILTLFMNKVNLLSHAASLGIPHLALSLDPVSSIREIQNLISKNSLRYPLVLKSLKGGAGYGIFIVRNDTELIEQVPVWLEQLAHHYDGETAVIVEKSLPSARHLIVPFISTGSEDPKHLPWVDASLQSRWKRMIQFCPASQLDPEAEKKVFEFVKTWVKSIQYVGMGSLEFLVDGSRVFIIDGVARLNAAFPFYEAMMGIRSVEIQLAGLGFVPAPKIPVTPKWKAGVSMRLYAEDPVRQIPTPGWIQEMSEPRRWNMGDTLAHLISAYSSNSEVPHSSSGVIGELYVFSQDRKHALQAARQALSEVWISGSLQTNQRFLIEHLEHPFVRENLIHAGFTDEEFIPEPFPDAPVLRRMATLAAQLFPSPHSRWVAGNQWIEPDIQPVQWIYGPMKFEHKKMEGVSGIARFADFQQLRFTLFPLGVDRWMVRLGLWQIPIRRVRPGGPRLVTSNKERKLVALAKGRVHALLQRVGSEIAPHQRILILESLGVLVPHAVGTQVKLIEWKVEPGQIVEQGQELAVLHLLG